MNEQARKMWASVFLTITVLWSFGMLSPVVAETNWSWGSNPCNPCSPQNSSSNPCNPCSPQGKANPCNPTGKSNPCNPCSPQGKMMNPCNPCAGKSQMNPCSPHGKMMNPCNPCSPHGKMNPCNPCAGKWHKHHKMNPCSPHGKWKKHHKMNPCSPHGKMMNPCNPCAGAKKSSYRKSIYGEKIEAVFAGKRLFSDTSLSGSGAISCSTCHNAQMPGPTPPNLTKSKAWPHYVEMGKGVITLDQIIQICIVKPMGGTAMAWDDHRLAALATYISGLPKQGKY